MTAKGEHVLKQKAVGEIIWEPSPERIENSGLYQFMQWVKQNKDVELKNYHELFNWSIEHMEDFWTSVVEFCDIKFHSPYTKVIQNDEKMYGTKWFEGATLNYVENIFKHKRGNERAIFFRSEHIEKKEYTWKELEEQVGALANSLRKLGVKKGDRVVAYMPNIPETVIAFLATASIGAIWSSCATDFGTKSVIDRFKQIEPVVLFAVDGYQYNGKVFDRTSVISELTKELPTLKHVVHVPYINDQHVDVQPFGDHVLHWDDLLEEKSEPRYDIVPFDHPLWILYSSGTTGMPKSIVQGHGGIVVEQMKLASIQNSIRQHDTVFWYTTTGWVMWNILISNLLTGASIVLYDGNPAYPNLDTLWKLAEDAEITSFGVGAPFLTICMKQQLKPKEKYDFSKLKSIYSTGAPLPAEAFNWVYNHVKDDVWLGSISGGTDVCTGFVGGVEIEPVRVGMIQGKLLGVDVHAFDEEGNSVINQTGELVVTKPMPSMPLYFWNDEGNKRYIDSYFDMYPGVWRHGDWIKFDETDSCIIFGRSDSTINRSGVRIGSSDIYRAVETLDEVVDSLVIDLELLNQTKSLYLFAVLKESLELDEELKEKIKQKIKQMVSPKFVPDNILQIDDVPKTLNGKKLEVPIRKILLGFNPDKVLNYDSMSNPESVKYFIELAKELNKNDKNPIM